MLSRLLYRFGKHLGPIACLGLPHHEDTVCPRGLVSSPMGEQPGAEGFAQLFWAAVGCGKPSPAVAPGPWVALLWGERRPPCPEVDAFPWHKFTVNHKGDVFKANIPRQQNRKKNQTPAAILVACSYAAWSQIPAFLSASSGGSSTSTMGSLVFGGAPHSSPSCPIAGDSRAAQGHARAGLV